MITASITPPTVKPDELDSITAQLTPPYRRIFDAITKWQIDLTFGDRTTPMHFDEKRLAKGCLLAQETDTVQRHNHGWTVKSSDPTHDPYHVTQSQGSNRSMPVCTCPDWRRAEERNFIAGISAPIFCKHTLAVLIASGQWDQDIARYAPPAAIPAQAGTAPTYQRRDDDWSWNDINSDECIFHLMHGHYTDRS